MGEVIPFSPLSAAAFTLQAPAKLNLFLHIIGRRDDGYHELQTLFQLLDYGDELSFRPAPPGRFSLTVQHTAEGADNAAEGDAVPQTSPHAPPLEDNLVTKAARLLMDWADTSGAVTIAADAFPGAEIHLLKRLPYGGGLGGGSSDAAAALLGLRRLWRLPIGDRQLLSIGFHLGADVPLFLLGYSAWADGIGERLIPVPIPPAWYLVITPDCMVPTAEIFAAEDLTRDSPRGTMFADYTSERRNDCEAVVRARYPEVDAALNWLGRHAGGGRMTGTGGAVFADFGSRREAEAVLARLPPGWRGFVARGMEKIERGALTERPRR